LIVQNSKNQQCWSSVEVLNS